jgi:hypothetical protein
MPSDGVISWPLALGVGINSISFGQLQRIVPDLQFCTVVLDTGLGRRGDSIVGGKVAGECTIHRSVLLYTRTSLGSMHVQQILGRC